MYPDMAGSRSLARTSLQESEGSGDGDVGVDNRVHHMHLHDEEGSGAKSGKVSEQRREEGRKYRFPVNNGRCQLWVRLRWRDWRTERPIDGVG